MGFVQVKEAVWGPVAEPLVEISIIGTKERGRLVKTIQKAILENLSITDFCNILEILRLLISEIVSNLTALQLLN